MQRSVMKPPPALHAMIKTPLLVQPTGPRWHPALRADVRTDSHKGD